jgi:hypothetical protein
MPRLLRPLALAAAAAVLAVACGDDDSVAVHPEREALPPTTEEASPVPTEAAPTTSMPPDEPDPFARPEWLGQRPLPLQPSGLGEIQPTPPELVDRRLSPPPHLPAPDDDEFRSTISEVPDAVVRRSTWQPACPVGLDDLRYLTVTFWGFDERHHTGELIVHRDHAEELVGVFARLHEARFPIEEMRVTRADELDAHPTGDGNNTGAFVCRPSVGSTSWSDHAYGRAVDINPFHNPYLRGEVVIPELASAYLDRDDGRPGMIIEGDVVTQAFDAIGWPWGGRWRSSKDWMHFSSSGR